jgi:hypothetical protein
LTQIETLVELYSIVPYDSQKLVDDVKKLIDIGVPLKVNDGTRDALDIVLNGILVHDEKTSEQLMNVAIELNNLGVVAEASHQELLERLKQKYPDIYDAQGSKLR